MRTNPFHPQETMSPAHKGASKDFIQSGYLRFVFLAITLFSGITARATNIRKVTGSTLDQSEASAINLDFQNVNGELMNCVHKTSTETIKGYKYISYIYVSSEFGNPSNSAPRANVTPSRAGLSIYNSTDKQMCYSTGTALTTWAIYGSSFTACGH